jgi:hypothetical protein
VLSSISSFHSSSSSIQQQDRSSRSLSKLGSMNASGSLAWNVRQAEARAAALSGIRAMPERPLALLYQLVELMKVRWCFYLCLFAWGFLLINCTVSVIKACNTSMCKLAVDICASCTVFRVVSQLLERYVCDNVQWQSCRWRRYISW